MFTLGNKEAIVNSNEKYPISINGTTLKVEGYGEFEQGRIKFAFGQRFIAARPAGMDLYAPSAAELHIPAGKINIPVSMKIKINSFRDEAAWAVDFIKKSKTFIIEFLVNHNDTNIQVAEKIIAAMKMYETNYVYSEKGLPFIFNTVGTQIIFLGLKEATLEFQNRVEFAVNRSIVPYVAQTDRFIHWTNTVATNSNTTVITLNTLDNILLGDTVSINGDQAVVKKVDSINTTITVSQVINVTTGDAVLIKASPVEPKFTGKYLEENVRMSLKHTSDSYGISPDEKPIISGKYTTISFEAQDDKSSLNNSWERHKGLGKTRGEIGGVRLAKFTLYFLEGSNTFEDNGTIEQLVNFLLVVPTAKFRISNGASVLSGSDFIQ